MKRQMFNALGLWALTFVFVASAMAGQATEIKLKDGSKWRGEIGNTVQIRYLQQGVDVPLEGTLAKVESLYVVIDGIVAGTQKQVTIFKSDIVSMKTTASGSPADVGAASTAEQSLKTEKPEASAPPAVMDDASIPKVFVLPLEGMVGETFRHEEIENLNAYLDKNYPPGQIVILRITSDGGSSAETTQIGKAVYEMRNRHRVVAWIEKAISAGCQTAMYCNEIYFMRQGTAGSVTTWSMGTGQAVRGPQLEKILQEFVEVAEANGYSKYIALSMKLNEYKCSYDKDPVTGEVTFYGDLSGEFKLSDENSNLCFNASNALHCGFSDGTADTPEQLAKLLNLPKWNEADDYGRRIARDWQRTCEKAKIEIPLAFERYKYKNRSTGDPVVIIGTHISITEDLIRWWSRCHNVCEMMGVPDPDDLEREVVRLRKQLADMRRR